ncbi:N-acetylglucosamine transport system permease protein [Leifsonia psychrotolerans]|uniref:N-acetylglucosamine transport system permease protein n=2 Tax=Glaciibacter psychrotolerans TaxID=670054 RepID=A0A7Z0J6E8_9MICO|nr:sugar ABC transporter permease [Leifsonia psychrotolerans]NYJ20151.1 N-acetylglucosamine transport system permease protein [Leifsonia psychrotolerans]
MTVIAPIDEMGGGRSAAAHRWSKKDLTFDKISFMIVFLVIPVVVYIVFVVSPFIQAFYYSLTDWSGFTSGMNFIGIGNYVKAFTDSTFLTAMGNSVLLALVLPIVTIGLALILASLVTVGGPSSGPVRGLRNSSIYRVVSFFPYVIPAIVIGIMWGQIYDPSSGLLNGILTGLGLDQFESFAWLGTKGVAMPAVMFVIVWGLVGFYMVLFVAAIKGVPAEIYEAARIDGAGRFRTAVTITIPLIRDNIQTAYIYMGILALDAFVYMAALEPGGGPANSTLVMSQQLFTTAFTKGQFGYACAMGVILAAITLLFAGAVFLVNRITGGNNEVAE